MNRQELRQRIVRIMEGNGEVYSVIPPHLQPELDKVMQAIDQYVEGVYKDVDRFEVIDDTGRAYVKGSMYGTPVKTELSLQDDDRTLKVFVSQRTGPRRRVMTSPTVSSGNYSIPKHKYWVEVDGKYLVDFEALIHSAQDELIDKIAAEIEAKLTKLRGDSDG